MIDRAFLEAWQRVAHNDDGPEYIRMSRTVLKQLVAMTQTALDALDAKENEA